MKTFKPEAIKLLEKLYDDIEAEEITIDRGYYCCLLDKIRKNIIRLKKKYNWQH